MEWCRRAGTGTSRTFTLIFTLACLLCSRANATEFHIATIGSDTNPGTSDRPFASLERARDAIRQLRRPLAEPVTVWIRGGTYVRTREMEFFAQDSGSETAPILYRSALGETVRFLGGPMLREWSPVTDRAVLDRLPSNARRNVRQISLRQLGMTSFGELRSRGWGRPSQIAAAELFLNGERMTLARWPNAEWAKIAGYPEASAQPDNHGGKVGSIAGGFNYSGDRPQRWADPTNVWVHGFWAWNWANSRERIASIDPKNHLIKTAPPGGHFGFRSGQRIAFYNALEELDEPGEWFLDRATGVLYFWPPRNADPSEAMISNLERPFITLRDASFLRFDGLSFEGTRSFGIWIQMGRSNQISSCIVRNIGNYGIWIQDGTGHSVVACDVYDTGDGGVALKGGDRLKLIPGGHRVENCHLHHNGVWTYTYVPAIKLDGVGLEATHNLIHDHSHTAILFEGNDHRIEYNEIHHVVQDTGDSGAIYTGRDWSFRGNKIRYNYFHDIVGYEDYGKGIYMDDCSSGAEIVGNVFQRMKRAIHLAGGRDHRVENNQFIDCETGIDVDGRGLDGSPIWQAGQKILRDQWNAFPAETRRLYVKRYPELRPLLPYLTAEKPVPPENNSIVRNVASGSGTLIQVRWHADRFPPVQKDNVASPLGGLFGSKSRRSLRLRADSPAWRLGFQPIPLDEMGLLPNDSRRSIPMVPGGPRLQ